ncbi:MAG TPA: pitrilysin family protein [Thermohalobaculum sp.]|nr:pitrilysin family protein [Thermohalobaculum sp.]
MTVLLDTLPNGFRVVTERMPGVASASLGVWVDAGSRHETEAENGIAHFLEHMAFKGTSRRNARQIAEEIEDVGGFLNAYTSRERTAYYARVLSADVPLAMDIIADILRDSRLAEADIEVERHVILQEIGQALDTPDDIIFDWLQETAFPGQPMGRAILGPTERVRNFGRADLGGFIGQHYHPGRMILAAAGEIDHDRIMRLAEGYYGDMPASAPVTAEPARFSGGEHRVVKPLEQAHVALALPSPSFRDDAYHAAQILSVALGGGMSSRLFQEARENRGLCYTIFAQCSAWTDSGMMTVYAGTGEEELQGLLDLTADELNRAARDLTEAEIARARAQTKAGLLMGMESVSARAERLASQLSAWGRIPPLDEITAKIDAVGVPEARAAAAQLLQAEPALALYGPVGAAGPVAEFRERLAA